jgi:cytochrome d ubiquinol oxidase subunit I
MEVLDLARWQFGITTVYHFFFVPLTIGLSVLVATMQTVWWRTGDERWLRLTKFFGKLFLINFAMGIATGIVQEFQFGMNWSDYSRFVGDVFGAPLAIEGLAAFFLESTFLGLWIFGWDRLPKKVHAACIWVVHVGTVLSAYFILAANSWMQNPVGYRFNPDTGRAELIDFAAVMFNKVQLATFPHTVLAAYMTGAAFMLGVALWLHVRSTTLQDDRVMHRKAMRLSAAVMLVSGLGVAVSGDFSGKVMTEVQPMKMAAAEALYDTQAPAAFSLFTIGSLDGLREKFSVTLPGVLSFLATGDPTAEVEGINELRATYEKTYGDDPGAAYYSAGGYAPIIPVTYWSFRFMIGLGLAAAAFAAMVLWRTRGGGMLQGRAWVWVAWAVPLLPLGANSFGWIFTEMGRQPWAVFGLMTTRSAVSPGVSSAEVLASLVSFTVLYGVLMVVEVGLILRAVRAGAGDVPANDPSGDHTDRPLVHAY